MSTLDRSPLFDWFHERLRIAARRPGAPSLSTDTELYLAALLVEHLRLEDDPWAGHGTLVELFAEATAAPASEQASLYRALGDRALVVVGWFPESLERKTVGRRYYVDMGASAYARAHTWLATAFGPVFRELSASFEGCVRLLDGARPRPVEDLLLRGVRLGGGQPT